MLHYYVDTEEFNEYFQNTVYRMCMAKKKKKRILWVKFVTAVNSTGCGGFIARIHITHFVQMDWPVPFGITEVIHSKMVIFYGACR